MTISAIDTGSVLYFSHDELPTVRPLTQEAVLPLIRRALAKARHPIPPAMEVKSFSSRQGVLFFVLPRLPQETAAAPLCAPCGAVPPRRAYAVCVPGAERTAALRRYAPERNDMELWDYVLLCVQCEAYAMVAPVLPELVSQWALTDQTLAMTALCLRHVPAEKERVLRCFSDELSEERDRLLHLLGDADECARLAASQPFFPPPATHEGYFTEECL